METQVMLKAGLIDLDSTYFVVLALFLVLYLVMWKAFFGPYIRFLRRREEATEGLRRRAREISEQVQALGAEIASRLSVARAEALQIRRNLADEGARLQAEMLAREHERMQQEIQRCLREIEQEKRKFLGEADDVAAMLAGLIEERARSIERWTP